MSLKKKKEKKKEELEQFGLQLNHEQNWFCKKINVLSSFENVLLNSEKKREKKEKEMREIL